MYARLRDDKAAVQAFFEKTSRQLILVLFPVYTGLALFSWEIALFVFGEKWLPAAPLFVAFGIAGLVRTLCAPFPQLMRGLGKPQLWMAWLLIFTAVLNVSLSLLLWANPTAGTAAWSRTLVKCLLEIPLLWWLARQVGLSFLPVLQFAGRWLLWLIPVIGGTLVVALVPAGFGLVLVLRTTVFVVGTGWLIWKGAGSTAFTPSGKSRLRRF
jgi:O-antigen/teichoic acid export membrane protein